MKYLFCIILIVLINTNGFGDPNSTRTITGISETYIPVAISKYGRVLGLSPDGSYIVVAATNNKKQNCIRFIGLKDMNVIKEIVLEDDWYIPRKKTAVWSDNGEYITFYKSGLYPVELQHMKGSPLYSINCKTGAIKTYSDDKYRKKLLSEDGMLYYDAYFLPGSNDLVFQRYSRSTISIVKSNGKNVVPMFAATDKSFDLSGFPLSDHLLLMTKKDIKAEVPAEVILYDANDASSRLIYRDTVDANRLKTITLRTITPDRRMVVLYNRLFPEFLEPDLYCDTIFLLTFFSDFAEYVLQKIVVPKNYTINNCLVSSDGRYLIYIQRYIPLIGDHTGMNSIQIILHDISTNKDQVMKTIPQTDEDFLPILGMADATWESDSQGMFLGGNRLMIYWGNEYRIFTLK